MLLLISVVTGEPYIYSIINGCWNIRSQDYSFPGTFIPWNFRFLQTFPSADHLFPEPFVPWNFRSRYPGPFLPRTIRSFVCRAVSGPLTKKEQRNKQKCRPITATVHSRYMQTVDWRYSTSRLNRFSSS